MDISARPKNANVTKFAPHPVIKPESKTAQTVALGVTNTVSAGASTKAPANPAKVSTKVLTEASVKAMLKGTPKNIAATASATSITLAKKPTKMIRRAPSNKTLTDKPHQPHPIAKRALAKAEAKRVAQKPAQTLVAKEIKDSEIIKALAKESPSNEPVKDSKNFAKWRRRALIFSILAVILAGGAYATYNLVPGVSVGIASAQAGIDASFPEYIPDGFSLKQPVTYSDGEVDLVFKSNSNDSYYQVKQARSSWDSSAVLDNVVKPAAGDNYATVKEKGLTIYTYEQQAAWVNGGILHTITGDAALSNDQVRRIATSL